MKTKFHITFLTLFPEMFNEVLNTSLLGKALEKGIWEYNLINIRDFGFSRHKKVDSKPCAGGHGMVMRPDVLGKAIDFTLERYGKNQKIFYMSPKGTSLTQELAYRIVQEYSSLNIIIICGRFEGLDQRLLTYYNVEEISIGDFVISGGELAAMVFVDCLVRLLDGFASNAQSIKDDSFAFSGQMQGLLEYPLYTKPVIWQGLKVPQVLLSGNHAEIDSWKLSQAQEITKNKRPDLWQLYIKKQKK